jgi:hypothetical protein
MNQVSEPSNFVNHVFCDMFWGVFIFVIANVRWNIDGRIQNIDFLLTGRADTSSSESAGHFARHLSR